MIPSRTIAILGALTALLISSDVARSQASEPSTPENESGTPIHELIAIVAKKTGKQFLVDPRVRARVTVIGQDVGRFDYANLLAVLNMHGYAAVERDGYVNIMPDANSRQWPVPIVTGRESVPDSAVVTKVIPVKSISAAQLVPVLRPMVPQYGHMVAYPCRNTLILVDTFANVKRIEKVIQSFDVGEPYTPEPELCKVQQTAQKQGG
jgi:general secretion pathway protein D